MRKNSLKHALLLCLLFLSGIIFIQCSSDSQVQKALTAMAESINKDCPITYDQFTRLDSCEDMPGKVFRYNYTVDFEKLNITVEELEKRMKPYLLSGIRIGAEMKGMRDNDVIFEYVYRGKDRKTVSEFKITPEEYKANTKK